MNIQFNTFSVVSIFNFSLENIHIEKSLKNKYEKIFPFLFWMFYCWLWERAHIRLLLTEAAFCNQWFWSTWLDDGLYSTQHWLLLLSFGTNIIYEADDCLLISIKTCHLHILYYTYFWPTNSWNIYNLNFSHIEVGSVSAVLQTVNRWSCTKDPPPARSFSWLKVPASAFTFKTLLRHYAKHTLTPRHGK